MGKLKVLAGDFIKGDQNSFSFTSFSLLTEKHRILGERIDIKEVEEVSLANEETVKKLGGTVGWGLAGAALLGPAGLLAGALLGGKKKEVTFVVKFKDGRKLMAITDSKTWTDIQAKCF